MISEMPLLCLIAFASKAYQILYPLLFQQPMSFPSCYLFCTDSLLQVLFHSTDFGAVSLYAGSCLVMSLAAILLPIETKGMSMKVYT